MNCVFAKIGASVWEHHCQELLVVTENLNGKRFLNLAAQILGWKKRHFTDFTFQLLLTWSVCFYALQVCWVVGAFHNCPQELAGQLSALCWRRRRRLGGVEILLFYLALDLEQQLTCAWHQNWALLVPQALGNPFELQLFCHFTMMEEALGVLVLGCKAQLFTWEFLEHLPRAVCAGEAGQRCHSWAHTVLSCFPE